MGMVFNVADDVLLPDVKLPAEQGAPSFITADGDIMVVVVVVVVVGTTVSPADAQPALFMSSHAPYCVSVCALPL